MAYFHEASGSSAGELAPQQHAVATRQREFASRRLPASSDKKYLYFDIQKDAERVYPLNKRRCSRQGPIEYVPLLRFRVALPQVPRNTTRLKLAVFASGNADEEFWYTNVFDKYKRRFEEDGYAFLGHSPLRYVSVWVDGGRIAVQLPQPYVFTGGFSPPLWNPVVGLNAFDLVSIDIDVSPLLLLLWELAEHQLEISVDNGLDDFERTQSGIGHDWIIGANLLAYENSNVQHAHGRFLSVDEPCHGQSMGISLPYARTLHQFVLGEYTVDFSSELHIELHGGAKLSTTVAMGSAATAFNVQSYEQAGAVGQVVHSGCSRKWFRLTDNAAGSVFHENQMSTDYPLVISFKDKPTRRGYVSHYDIIIAKDIELTIDGKTIMNEQNTQNGASHFVFRDGGVSGSSAMSTKFRFFVDGRTKNFLYKRQVEAANGEIVADRSLVEDV